MKRTTPFIVAILLLSVIAFAAEQNDAQAAYCNYITEQAFAQRDILRTPSAVVGPIQPSTGTPPQMVFGLSSSLANVKKSVLTMDVARTTCGLYSAATDAQQHIYYALPLLEKDFLRHRIELIQEASGKLDTMIAENNKLVAARNMTRQAVYYLQAARVRLDMSRTATLTGIISPYVPPLSSAPLRTLIQNKLEAEVANQKAISRLTKQSGWDIEASGGARRQIGQFTSTVATTGAYGTFGLTYNFGRTAANAHLDHSVSAYSEWKKDQFDDVAQQSLVLKKQIEETIEIQEGQLKVLTDQDVKITTDLASLDGVETSNALTFRNQLLADQVVLRVDIGDTKFRLERLRQYFAENF